MNQKIRKPYPKRIIYENGLRFNNFIILDSAPPTISKTGVSYTSWKCKCDCGIEFITTTKQIQKGKKSCGCLSVSNRFKKVNDEEFFKNLKYGHYITSAKNRDLIFDLDIDYFYSLLIGNCKYCGSSPSLNKIYKKHSMFLNGIDRVDNQLGYVIGNVVTCCKICNSAKSNLTLIDFEKWIDNLVKFKTKI